MSELDYGFSPHKNSDREEITVGNDGFFPNLNLKDFIELYGIPLGLTDEQVKHVLLLAMDRINGNGAVEQWVAEKQRNGAITLADTGRRFGDFNGAVEQYKRAVFASAKVDLIRDYTVIDRKADGENAALNAAEQIAHYESISTRALAELMGKPRIGVYSI